MLPATEMGIGESLLVGDCKISPGHGDYDADAVYDDVKLIPRHAGIAPSGLRFCSLPLRRLLDLSCPGDRLGVLRSTMRAVCFHAPHFGRLFLLGTGRFPENDLFAAIHADDEKVITRFDFRHRDKKPR
jgi:hypothetical protein